MAASAEVHGRLDCLPSLSTFLLFTFYYVAIRASFVTVLRTSSVVMDSGDGASRQSSQFWYRGTSL